MTDYESKLEEDILSKEDLNNTKKCLENILSDAEKYRTPVINAYGTINTSESKPMKKYRANAIVKKYGENAIVEKHDANAGKIHRTTSAHINVKQLENFLKKNKTTPILVENLKGLIDEIDEINRNKAPILPSHAQETDRVVQGLNGAPIMLSELKLLESTTTSRDELQLIGDMGTKLENWTWGFPTEALYIRREYRTGQIVNPKLETILEMYKNVAGCYIELANNVRLIGGKKSKIKTKSKPKKIKCKKNKTKKY
jgi:hypothetical protein